MRRAPRIFGAVVLGVTAAMALLSPAAAAKPTASVVILQPRFGFVTDWSQCDDGGGTADCTATSGASTAGIGRADASLGPIELVATGRAEGRGGPGGSHKITSPVAGVRYRFVFEGISATASTTPAVARDLAARGAVAGHVWHSRCSGCKATAYQTVVDTDTFSPTPESVSAQSQVVELEMRNPDGLVPAGTLSASGFFLADIGPYVTQPNFTSSGTASIEGRLSRIEVIVLRS